MLKYTLLRVFYFLLFFAFGNLYAQNTVDNQQLLWLRYNLKVKLGKNYQVQQEVEERAYLNPWRQHQFVSRTHLEKSFSNDWKVAIAFTLMEQALPHNPEIKDYVNVTELRPILGVYNTQTVSDKLSLEHRYWNELRFFEQPNGTFNFRNIRSRYRLSLQYNIIENVTLKVFDEIHLNIGNDINIFDQNRYGGSIQFATSDALGFEIGYLNWFQQKTLPSEFYNRNIIRFTIHHNINLKKVKKVT